MPTLPRSSSCDGRVSPEDEDVFVERESTTADFRGWKLLLGRLKLLLFVVAWLLCCCALLVDDEEAEHRVSVPENETVDRPIGKAGRIWLTIEGPLLPPLYENLSDRRLHVWFRDDRTDVSPVWTIPVVPEHLLGAAPAVRLRKLFDLTASNRTPRVALRTDLAADLPLTLSGDVVSEDGVSYAVLVLAGLYALIVSEATHRTTAALFACTVSVAALTALGSRPTMAEIVSWMEAETLTLLFSMMVLVAALGETGAVDRAAVAVYRAAGGRVWPTVSALCLFAGAVSCLLDNVTTALLTTPVAIRFCEMTGLDAVPVLVITVICSNLGGAVTPIGDPPNVIVASDDSVKKSGVDFGVFTLHMGLGTVLAGAVVYLQLRCFYGEGRELRTKEPPADPRKTTVSFGPRRSTYDDDLKNLEDRYRIKDEPLLVKSLCVLLLVVVVFFLHSVPELVLPGLGRTALLGALLLLLLVDDERTEALLARVEWSTLLFFAALFVLMEALARLGLIEWIGERTRSVVASVDRKDRLAVAILLFLWVSAVASAFVDNVPLTTMMLRVATGLADDEELGLPLQPLIWAVAFGACFGGNGSLLGASSNIVCAGIAEQHGYKVSFAEFLRIGLPVTITSVLVITVYLLVCHVVLAWH